MKELHRELKRSIEAHGEAEIKQECKKGELPSSCTGCSKVHYSACL